MSKKSIRCNKKPPNAFILFCRDTRPSLVQKFPKMPSSDVSSLLSHLWKSLDPLKKENYKQQAQQLLLLSDQNPKLFEPSTFEKNLPYSQNNSFESSPSESGKIEVNHSHQTNTYYPMLSPNELFYQIIPDANLIEFQSIFGNMVGDNAIIEHSRSKI